MTDDDDLDSSEKTPTHRAPPLYLNGDPELMSDSQRNRIAGGADVAKRLAGSPPTEAERRYIDMMRPTDPEVLMFRLAMWAHKLEAQHDTGERQRAKDAEELQKLPDRVAKIEATIDKTKHHGLKAAGAVVVAVLGSATAVYASITGAAAEKAREQEQILNLQHVQAEQQQIIYRLLAQQHKDSP